MVMKEELKELKNQGFSQVCIWHATIVVNDPEQKEAQIKDFEDWFLESLKTRVKYLEEVKTNPDYDDTGKPIAGTGERNDVFFIVHKDDIGKFAIPRLQYGIRWYEDVVHFNNQSYLYPKSILDKYNEKGLEWNASRD